MSQIGRKGITTKGKKPGIDGERKSCFFLIKGIAAATIDTVAAIVAAAKATAAAAAAATAPFHE